MYPVKLIVVNGTIRKASHRVARARIQRIRDACSAYRRSVGDSGALGLDRPLKSLPAMSFLIADDRHKVVYCSIPKVGCTTFKLLMARSLDRHQASPEVVHFRPILASLGLRYLNTFTERGIQLRLESYFKFIVVRHPFDRLLSAYADRIANPERNIMNISQIRKRAELRYGAGLDHDGHGRPLLSLEQFLELIANDRRFRNKHWESYALLCQPCRVNYSHVIRLETLDADIGPVMDRLSYSSTDHRKSGYFIPHEHNERKDTKKLTEVFHQLSKINQDIIPKLLNVYRYDFDLFGYTWNNVSGAGFLDDGIS